MLPLPRVCRLRLPHGLPSCCQLLCQVGLWPLSRAGGLLLKELRQMLLQRCQIRGPRLLLLLLLLLWVRRGRRLTCMLRQLPEAAAGGGWRGGQGLQKGEKICPLQLGQVLRALLAG